MKSRTSTPALVAYAGPAMPLAMLGMPLVVYVPPFYAAELGLDLAAVGAIFFLARAWDAVTDPVIGHLSDRTRSRWGRRKPWLLAGAPLLMVGVFAFLSPPEGIGRTYLALTAFGFYVAWTILQIPYLSWGAELSRDYDERTRITGIRETGTMVGIVLATLIPIVFLRGADPSLREILWVFVVALLVLIPLTCVVAAVRTPTASFVDTADRSLSHAVRFLPRNKPLLRILAGVFFLWLGGSVYNTCLVFMVEHVLELPRSAFLQFVLVQYSLAILCVPLWVRIANRIGRHRVLVLGGLGFLALQPLFLLASPGVFWHALLVYIISGPIVSVIWIMPPALVADTIEYGMMKGGGDDAALYMAVYNFIVKIAMAGGVGVALPLLAVFGFNPVGDNTSTALNALRFIALVLPVLIGAVGAVVLYNHPLTAQRHAIIKRWLARKGLAPFS